MFFKLIIEMLLTVLTNFVSTVRSISIGNNIVLLDYILGKKSD